MNVALFIYNRPAFTKKVVRQIRNATPRRLFVIADGPRCSADHERCETARAIVDCEPWECLVQRNYADRNLGCRKRVISGLNWVFDQVDDAIILEDDCVPDGSFFPFCQEMLEYFHGDLRVGHISGNNFLGDYCSSPYSYYFSRYSSSWGWATWRRAWMQFGGVLQMWPDIKAQRRHYDLFLSRKEAVFYETIWDAVYQGNTHIWDAQWLLARLVHSSLSVIPRVNLVTNVGWGREGTYTKDVDNPAAGISTRSMTFPIRHPPFMICDAQADRYLVDNFLIGRRHLARETIRRLKNKHVYGKVLRKVPFVGPVWARFRSARSEMHDRGL